MPGEALHELIEALIAADQKRNPERQVDDIPTLLDLFIPEPDAQAAVRDLLIDYVFNLSLAMAKSALMPDSAGHPENTCFETMFQTFRLEESDAKRLSRVAIGAAREANRSRANKSKSQPVNEEYCYLCGNEFLDSIEENTSVDHVWPKRAAGTKNKSNLYRCHERCEIPKWDTVGAGDVASLRFAFKKPDSLLVDPVDSDWIGSPTASKGELLRLFRDFRHAQLRVGVAARQRYRCDECDRSFLDQTRGFRIVKREDNVPWAYTNTIAVCDSCHLERGEQNA